MLERASSPRRGQFLQKPVINHFTGSSQRRSFSRVCVCVCLYGALNCQQPSIKEETIAEHNSAVMTEWTIKSTSYKRLVATLIYRDGLRLSFVGTLDTLVVPLVGWTHCKFDAMQKQLHTLRCISSVQTRIHGRVCIRYNKATKVHEGKRSIYHNLIGWSTVSAREKG